MKKLNNINQEDQNLHQFFDELKLIEKQQPIPSFEALSETSLGKKNRLPFLRYAAVLAVLFISVIYLWAIKDRQGSMEITEIVISYGSQEMQEVETLGPEGMDQWQSETDILLTGL